MIVYESPHRIKQTLKRLYEYFGNRKIVIAREISKKFEEYIREDLYTFNEKLKNENFELLGEIIVVIDGNKNSAFISELSDEDIQHLLLQKMSQNISKKDAVKQVSKENNINKNRVYDISINL